MTPETILASRRTDVPEWLARWKPGDRFVASDFLSSRVVYYPGSGCHDGQCFRVFGASHAAHCFIHVDYGIARERVIDRLAPGSRGALRGYRILDQRDLSVSDVAPSGWSLPADLLERGRRGASWVQGWMDSGHVAPYGLLHVFERADGFGDDHGPARIASIFFGADGIATYAALFCQPGRTCAPFAMLLQDHGFGGNYDRFGDGGLLHDIARRTRVLPRFVLGERSWAGYRRVSDEWSVGGYNYDRRFLFEFDATATLPGA